MPIAIGNSDGNGTSSAPLIWNGWPRSMVTPMMADATQQFNNPEDVEREAGYTAYGFHRA